MRELTRVVTAIAAFVFVAILPAQQRTIDDFFRDFTDDWVRHNPNLATSNRYFTGEEQDRLERQVTPQTLGARKDNIRRARPQFAARFRPRAVARIRRPLLHYHSCNPHRCDSEWPHF